MNTIDYDYNAKELYSCLTKNFNPGGGGTLPSNLS